MEAAIRSSTRVNPAPRSKERGFLEYEIFNSPHIHPRSKEWGFTRCGVKNRLDLGGILKYKTLAYLFDTFDKKKFGGTGKSFNWSLLTKEVKDIKIPLFLSGGLDKEN